MIQPEINEFWIHEFRILSVNRGAECREAAPLKSSLYPLEWYMEGLCAADTEPERVKDCLL